MSGEQWPDGYNAWQPSVVAQKPSWHEQAQQTIMLSHGTVLGGGAYDTALQRSGLPFLMIVSVCSGGSWRGVKKYVHKRDQEPDLPADHLLACTQTRIRYTAVVLRNMRVLFTSHTCGHGLRAENTCGANGKNSLYGWASKPTYGSLVRSSNVVRVGLSPGNGHDCRTKSSHHKYKSSMAALSMCDIVELEMLVMLKSNPCPQQNINHSTVCYILIGWRCATYMCCVF